ncbi:MAG: DUF2288 domain-containing protein [Bdellovibrionales bacterium]|nr:DUF2288 domain-containing protein [Bdellovibrionales bacterium]
MSDELKEKLSTEIETCDWSMLSIHNKSDSIIVVEASLDLLEAGVALATDDVEKVKGWQNKGQIRRPLPKEVESWEKSPNEKLAKFIIIQPFVLIQLLN